MAIVEVTSDRDPQIVYTVDTEAKTCTCPFYVNRLAHLNANTPPDQWKTCKHIDRALLYQEKVPCAS